MTIAYISHPSFVLHDMGGGHPEAPGRLAAIEDELISSGLQFAIRRYEAPAVTREQLERVLDENRKVQGRFDRLRVDVERPAPTTAKRETTVGSTAGASAGTDLTGSPKDPDGSDGHAGAAGAMAPGAAAPGIEAGSTPRGRSRG